MGWERRGGRESVGAYMGSGEGMREEEGSILVEGGPRLMPVMDMAVFSQPRFNTGVQDGEPVIKRLGEAEGVLGA